MLEIKSVSIMYMLLCVLDIQHLWYISTLIENLKNWILVFQNKIA